MTQQAEDLKAALQKARAGRKKAAAEASEQKLSQKKQIERAVVRVFSLLFRDPADRHTDVFLIFFKSESRYQKRIPACRIEKIFKSVGRFFEYADEFGAQFFIRKTFDDLRYPALLEPRRQYLDEL